jgi:transcriptional regulator with XRE-family HTH domain
MQVLVANFSITANLSHMENAGRNQRYLGPISMAVSAELRAALARKGWNVQRFAAISGLPLSTLHKTFKGQRVVDVEDVFAICEFLDADPADIIHAADMATRPHIASVTELRFNVSGYVDDALHGIDTAAGTDETQADED